MSVASSLSRIPVLAGALVLLFLILESEDLLRIRQRIGAEFVAAGGKPDAWSAGHGGPK